MTCLAILVTPWPRTGWGTVSPVGAAPADPCPMCDAAAEGLAEAPDWSVEGPAMLAFGMTLLIEDMAGCFALLRDPPEAALAAVPCLEPFCCCTPPATAAVPCL